MSNISPSINDHVNLHFNFYQKVPPVFNFFLMMLQVFESANLLLQDTLHHMALIENYN